MEVEVGAELGLGCWRIVLQGDLKPLGAAGHSLGGLRSWCRRIEPGLLTCKGAPLWSPTASIVGY